ncbi:hypothetical protein [Gallaecimonas mangrovi]|uniref:hypothetical protein n=1 Tax=Gallaecimonas mangrovi TaxID=2291597 RepID=UPI000E20BBD7|nr:hypothetical protein [Gallaecimonas mangrovi]
MKTSALLLLAALAGAGISPCHAEAQTGDIYLYAKALGQHFSSSWWLRSYHLGHFSYRLVRNSQQGNLYVPLAIDCKHGAVELGEGVEHDQALSHADTLKKVPKQAIYEAKQWLCQRHAFSG